MLCAGAHGLVAHECILDLPPLTAAAGVSADDVAKRLVDFGFHAPTVSFPAAGTLMVEPTEFEDLPGGRPLRRRHGRIRAEVFPGGTRPDKDWPPVGRIEHAHGDRNLICTCPPLSAFEI